MSFQPRHAPAPPRAAAIIILVAFILAGSVGHALAQGATERIEFSGFSAGQLIRDQFAPRGVRFPADANGGPYYDDADTFSFLLDSPPGLMSLNPLSAVGGPNVVHASVGTYVFDFVDPSNPFVGSETDSVLVAVGFPDSGDTVLQAWDAAGNLIGESTISLIQSSFYPIYLSVNTPGIRKATLTTPLQSSSIGALIDTLTYNRPSEVPALPVSIDIRPGSPRNTVRLGSNTTVRVALLSSPGFEPETIDPAMVLFQGAFATSGLLQDKNRDRVRDWVFTFDVADLTGLTSSSTEASLTAVLNDGTPIRGTDSITIQSSRLTLITPSTGTHLSGRPVLEGSGSH